MTDIDVGEIQIRGMERRRGVETVRLLPCDRGVRQVAAGGVPRHAENPAGQALACLEAIAAKACPRAVVDARAPDVEVGVRLLVRWAVVDAEQPLVGREVRAGKAHA